MSPSVRKLSLLLALFAASTTSLVSSRAFAETDEDEDEQGAQLQKVPQQVLPQSQSQPGQPPHETGLHLDTPIPAPPPGAGQPLKLPDTTHAVTPSLDETNDQSDEANTSYWSRGKNRWFVSTADDVGYLYARPRVSFGYGKPFWKWVGVDLNPQGSNRFLGAYGGLRAAIPLVDVRVGARYVWDFQQYYLVPANSYHRIDFQSQELSRASYTTLEAEITGNVPVGPGSLLGVASGSYMTGVPKDVFVYDETLRIIIKPPYEWRLRGGYAVRLGAEGKISVGIVADVLGMPGRRSGEVLRAGIIASATLSNHIEILGSFVPPIISPDTIGVAGGDFAQLGVRYRWATDSPPENKTPR